MKTGKNIKKKLLVTLALASLVSFAGTTFAAPANPFGDVPARHWAYEAVTKLMHDGIIDGDGKGNFQGDRPVTRYEMAQLVARAVWNLEKANAEDKALVNKLSDEFDNELKSLGVRVDNLEKKSEKITVSGFLHLSEQIWNNSGSFAGHTAATGDTPHSGDGNYPALGIDMYINYKVNDKWQIKLEDESVRDFRTGGYWGNGSDGNVEASQHNDQMYAEGLVGATTIKAGKFDYGSAYGLIVPAGRKGVDGVQFAVGDKTKTILTYGYFRQWWTGNATNPTIISNSTENRYAAIEYDTPLAKDANFKAAYHHLSNNGSDSTVISDKINLWEVGADKMLNKESISMPNRFFR